MVDYFAFLKRLEGYYSHSKKFNDYEAEAIVGLLEKRAFTQHQLDQLYQTVIENMEHLPKLVKIRGVVDNPETGRFDKHCDYADASLSDGRLMSVEQILNRCRTLHKEQYERELLSTEIDFLHRWDDLIYFDDVWNHRSPDEPHRKHGHLESVKKIILEGGKPSYDMEPMFALKGERKKKTQTLGDVMEDLF